MRHCPFAFKVYDSNEQIDNIEEARHNVQSKGLLLKDNKIMVYGGSGDGVLVQQYLNKYEDHVSRALIESSGGSDLARKRNATFIKHTYESNPSVANPYFALSQKADATASLAFMLFKIGLKGDLNLQNIIINIKTNIFVLGDKFTY